LGEIELVHDMSAPPSQLMLLQCGAVSGVDCLTRVVVAGTRGYQDGLTFVNPISVTSDGTNIFIGMFAGWWAWGYWTPATNWQCEGRGDCRTAWYRVLAWR